MDLFLQGQILIHQVLYLPGKSSVLLDLIFGLVESSKIDRYADHQKDGCCYDHREPPWNGTTGCRLLLGISGPGVRPRTTGPHPRLTSPVNICGLAQVTPPDRCEIRSPRKF